MKVPADARTVKRTPRANLVRVRDHLPWMEVGG